MRWSDISFDPSRKVLRQFAAMWLVCLLALAAHQWLAKHHLLFASILASAAVVVGLPGLVRPALMRWLFVTASVLAFPAGWLISTVVLAVLYFVVLTPLAIFFRLRGRDLLGRKPATTQDTFWEPKQTPLDPRGYFRQY